MGVRVRGVIDTMISIRIKGKVGVMMTRCLRLIRPSRRKKM